MLKNNDVTQFGKVAVLMGGWSAEREVSLMSGTAVLNGLKRKGVNAFPIDAQVNLFEQLNAAKPDRVFIIMHGIDGESGFTQAVLESMKLPYTGSGVAACALTLDKVRTKWVWKGAGLPTPEFVILKENFDPKIVVDKLGLPLFVKPARDGSSLGVSKVNQLEELAAAYKLAAQQDELVIAEQYMSGGEYTVSIIGTEIYPSIKIETPRVFYDYVAKYFTDTTQYICPSDLNPQEEKEISALAWEAYQVCGCVGWGRVDVIRDGHGKFHLIEINTAPGMTDHSLVPLAGRVKGVEFDDLVMKILAETL